MKRIFLYAATLISSLLASNTAEAQGWPNGYGGVMLQGFYWDSFIDTRWSNLESQADEIAPYFSLMWIPQSGNCNSGYNVMGYTPVYWYDHNSTFGSEAELRSMIATYKRKGTGMIADVVVNHRNGVSRWLDFPAETYGGKTWQLTAADVCCNDEVNTDQSAGSEYGMATGAADTGDNFGGARDLDHTSLNVQENVTNYLQYLLNDLGYAGFRYDMVKGFSGQYVKQYNEAAKPEFSVGEYWDGATSAVGNWITTTGKTSAAFDFPLKFMLNSACNQGGYYGDTFKGISSTGAMFRSATNKRYAVTFAENHDTNYEQSQSSNCLKRDTLAANAYILGIPGTPCVFLTHWKAWKNEIRQMILARKAAGITNNGTYTEKGATSGKNGYYAWQSGNLIGVLGGVEGYEAPADYTLIIDGASRHYRYYLANSVETAWASVPTCDFESTFDVTLTAVSATAGAQVVYTLDGSDPTAASNVAAEGTAITISATTTLKFGLLKNSEVTAVETRQYTYKPFESHPATIYVSTDLPAGWNAGSVNFHVWDSNNNRLTTNDWPGDKQTATVSANGKEWYAMTFDITSRDYFINVVFSSGNGAPQTVDVTGISSDSFFKISATKSGDKNLVNKVTFNEKASARLVGGDLSMLPEYEKHNSGYLDNAGNMIPDLLTWLRDDCGWNAVRVRLFVNPKERSSKKTGVVQDIEYVKQLGKRIKDAGMQFVLDMHYSDAWADPSFQIMPAAWSDCTTTALKADKVYAYTKETLEALKASGAEPDYVQVGNEISYGMLGIKVMPYEHSGDDWNGFVNVLKKGTEAVREVCPEAKIIIHTERSGESGQTQYFYDKLSSVDYDVVGLSYYPFYHGDLSKLKATLATLKNSFPDKDVQIVETAYPFQYYPSDAKFDVTSTWAATPAGQYAYTKDLINALASFGNVKGLYWWFPEEAGCGDDTDWDNGTATVIDAWVNRGLWWLDTTSKGHWPVSCDEGMVHYLLKTFIDTDPAADGISKISSGNGSRTDAESITYDLAGRRLGNASAHGIYITKGRKIVRK